MLQYYEGLLAELRDQIYAKYDLAITSYSLLTSAFFPLLPFQLDVIFFVEEHERKQSEVTFLIIICILTQMPLTVRGCDLY